MGELVIHVFDPDREYPLPSDILVAVVSILPGSLPWLATSIQIYLGVYVQ